MNPTHERETDYEDNNNWEGFYFRFATVTMPVEIFIALELQAKAHRNANICKRHT